MTDLTTHTLLDPDHQRLCVMHLLAAYAHARSLGDKALAGYVRAVLRRAEHPIRDLSDAEAAMARHKVDRDACVAQNWSIAVEQIDKWVESPGDDRPFTDIAREVFNTGYSCAMNVIQPLWNDRRLCELADLPTEALPS